MEDFGGREALAAEKLAVFLPVDTVCAGTLVGDTGGKSLPGKLIPPDDVLDLGVKGRALTAVLAAWVVCCPMESFIASAADAAPDRSIDVGIENPPAVADGAVDEVLADGIDGAVGPLEGIGMLDGSE